MIVFHLQVCYLVTLTLIMVTHESWNIYVQYSD